MTDYIDKMLVDMTGLFAEHREEPADDLLSALIAATSRTFGHGARATASVPSSRRWSCRSRRARC
ncbi:hypothetical protein [Saccharopolyspora spinosa]|uniref:Uncharacterized protein n=1 Tax=Saccharopolyspora spinosa TaxID=60894 RepID=A0A2N3XW19_SACSN|nr:hypothetical protein [Saccharopolyspora spinosa]PKW14883.1 hypothetical protein A8926_2537 [Saccharopolyspora spinosa]